MLSDIFSDDLISSVVSLRNIYIRWNVDTRNVLTIRDKSSVEIYFLCRQFLFQVEASVFYIGLHTKYH